jgi:hypothetical protein
MSTADTRFSALLEQFTGDLQNTNEDIRRRAVDELYAHIIAQYADVSKDISFLIYFGMNFACLGTNRCGDEYCRTSTRICSKENE